jgi:xanthine/CO dehydrogenase XdhC/CoxF family maturation factor
MEEDGATFVHVHNPPLRMIVVGAVHIAQALLPMARLAGYDVSLVDPRPAFAQDTRFPGEAVVEDWPDEALDALAPDARTAIVTLTHDPKLDDPAIARALGSDMFYLGCLGSTRTHAKRVARLTEAGFTEARSPASTRPSASISARAARRRSRCRSWPRSPAAAPGMKFGPVPVAEAEGAILAHSLRVAGRRLKKGRADG